MKFCTMLLAAKYSGDPGLPFAASGPDVNFERLLFIKKVFGASGPQTGSLCCDSVLIHVVNLKDVLSTGYSEWFAAIAAVSMPWSPLALPASFFVRRSMAAHSGEPGKFFLSLARSAWTMASMCNSNRWGIWCKIC